MSDRFEETFEDDVKNLYVIKRRLADVKMNSYGYFEYQVGNSYLVKIYPIGKFPIPPQTLTLNKTVHVYLYELYNDKYNIWNGKLIDISKDSKFKNYQPIKYHEHSWMNNGENMPILQLCELVKYLHRLANLSIFS